MEARNKQTGVECEVFWLMCDCGRKCSASDKPHAHDEGGYVNYNAVVDDYEFLVDGEWIDGLEYIKHGGVKERDTLAPQETTITESELLAIAKERFGGATVTPLGNGLFKIAGLMIGGKNTLKAFDEAVKKLKDKEYDDIQ